MEPPPPESYGGLTAADIHELTDKLPSAIAEEVQRAARILNVSLCIAGNTRNWRELVDEDFPVEIVMGDLDALDRDGEINPNSAAVKAQRYLPDSLRRAFLAFAAAMRLARAPADALISDSVQRLVVKRSQTLTSQRAATRRQLEAADRSAKLREFARDILGNLKRDVHEQSIRWLVGEIQTAWCQKHHAETDPPSRSTLTPIVRALLPDHPVNKQKK